MTTITDAQRAQLAEAFASPALRLGQGLGKRGPIDSGERCTIAEINLVLTGTLSADPHPCISEVIRRWVIRIQDAMPDELRNSAAWRSVAPLIAGTATEDERVESERRDMIMAWMWDRLADEAVLAALPDEMRPAWDRMLTERTSAAARRVGAYSAAAAASAIAAHVATSAAAVAVTYTADDRQAYWRRADPAGLLARLVTIRQEGS
jgi:hypothetical protein